MDAYISTGQGSIGHNMYAYCGNNPINRTDSFGYCYYNANGKWCHDNWEYIGGYVRKPDPGYYKGTTETGKHIYIGKDKNYSTALNGVMLLDLLHTNINPKTNKLDPNIIVLDSYKITDEAEQNQILGIIETYVNDSLQEGYEWGRTRDSLLQEWKIHNKAYEWGLKRDSTCDCDFNKDDEGKGWIQFIWDGFTK